MAGYVRGYGSAIHIICGLKSENLDFRRLPTPPSLFPDPWFEDTQ